MTRQWRGMLVASVVWATVVALTASLAWLVIDRAGRDVGEVVAAGYTETGTDSPAPPTARSTAPRTPTGAQTSHGMTPRPTGPARPSAPSSPRRTAAPSPSIDEEGNEPAEIERNFASAGGSVAAACDGAVIEFESATPRDGYRITRSISGGVLTVTFTRTEHDARVAPTGDDGGEAHDDPGEDDDDSVIRVRIACRGGVPTRV